MKNWMKLKSKLQADQGKEREGIKSAQETRTLWPEPRIPHNHKTLGERAEEAIPS